MKAESILPEARVRNMRAAGLWTDRILLGDFDHWAVTTPDRVAIVDHNSMMDTRTALSYRQLSQRVDRIASRLATLHVGRGDVVSMQLPNWWQFTALHLAALRLGAITNPIMPIFREREVRFMLHLAESKVLVIPREFRGYGYPAMAEAIRPSLPALDHVLVVGGDFERLCGDGSETEESRTRFAAGRPGADDVIELLYTSGTTGEPKGGHAYLQHALREHPAVR